MNEPTFDPLKVRNILNDDGAIAGPLFAQWQPSNSHTALVARSSLYISVVSTRR